MTDPKHVARLLELVAEELTALREIVPNPKVSDWIVGFHAQQIVEKALKAWIGILDGAYERTHDIRALLDALEVLGEDVISLRDYEVLNIWAVTPRYEGLPDDGEPLEREPLVNAVAALAERVSGLAKAAG